MRPDKVIYKQEFLPGDSLELSLPVGSRVVHIDEQFGTIQVWYEQLYTNETQDAIKVQLYVFATGTRIDDTNIRATYFRTVVMRNGLVWHFYISYSSE